MTPLPMCDIIDAAISVTGVPRSKLFGKTRPIPVVRVRKAIAWIAYPACSSVRIGAALGGRDHSTIRNLVKKAEYLVENDPEFMEMTAKIKAKAMKSFGERRQAVIELLAA